MKASILVVLIALIAVGKVNLTKTAGQSLDETIDMLKTNISALKSNDGRIVVDISQMKREIKELQLVQQLSLGSCIPCTKAAGSKHICDCTSFEPKKDCLAFYKDGFRVNGIYKLLNNRAFSNTRVYCDQTTMGGGWTVIQRRQDGSVDFNRNWNDYKNGFGNLLGEFWYGNEDIHVLTKLANAPNKSEILIDMRLKGQSKSVFAIYQSFEVGSDQDKYELQISGFSGNVSRDPMKYHNNMKFTTSDSDNDKWTPGNCATSTLHGMGGWWFNSCKEVNLNGPYNFSGSSNGKIYWDKPSEQQPEFVEMKVRRNY